MPSVKSHALRRHCLLRQRSGLNAAMFFLFFFQIPYLISYISDLSMCLFLFVRKFKILFIVSVNSFMRWCYKHKETVQAAAGLHWYGRAAHQRKRPCVCVWLHVSGARLLVPWAANKAPRHTHAHTHTSNNVFFYRFT